MKQSRGDENSISKYFAQQNEFNNVSVGVRETWWLVHSVFYFLLTMEQKVWQQPARSNWNYFIFLLLRRTLISLMSRTMETAGKYADLL